MTTSSAPSERSLGRDERTGVLDPDNLERYAARWFDPAPVLSNVVDRYWHVRWHLGPGEKILQRIIDAPAVTLTVEDGDVPGPLVITGLSQRAWRREIRGTGSAFGIRLRPAGLPILSSLRPQRVADQTLPLTPALDPSLHAMLAEIALQPSPAAKAAAADDILGRFVTARRVPPALLLANQIVEELSRTVRSRAGPGLADRFGVSERTVQRALEATLGRGPKWVSRRIRLQEIARAIATEPELDLSLLAVELGYTDQAHLIGDFRGVAGVTPGAYRRSLRALAPPHARS